MRTAMTKPMNKIEKLVESLCPEGVEFRYLGELCKTLRKDTLKTDELHPDGRYPVMNSGRDFYGRYDKCNNDGNALTVAARGEYAGFINYIDEKFWAGGLCYPYRSLDENNAITRYIFYALKNLQQCIRDTLVARGSIPALNKSDIDKFSIPIPPLAIQQEIVKILDTFTTLEAELEARKKQYEYYRDELLTFGEDVEYKTLGEVGEFVRGNGLPKSDFTESGVGCIHYGQIYTYYGTFTDKTKSFVSPETAKNYKKSIKTI
jgi:Restriction endonuclease S subunits